jgi:ribosomal protein L11 methylase PrmA
MLHTQVDGRNAVARHALHMNSQGMLAIGAALLGAASVLAVDVDADALDVAAANLERFDNQLPVRLCAQGFVRMLHE